MVTSSCCIGRRSTPSCTNGSRRRRHEPISYDPITPPGRLDVLQELRLPVDALGWCRRGWRRKCGQPAYRGQYCCCPATAPVRGPCARSNSSCAVTVIACTTGDRPQQRRGAAVAHRARAERPFPDRPARRSGRARGWSLGGFIAREYAREHPGHVRKVITLGTPVIGGPATPPRHGGIARRDTTSTSSSGRHEPLCDAAEAARHRPLLEARRHRRVAGLHRPVVAERPPRRGRGDARRPGPVARALAIVADEVAQS